MKVGIIIPVYNERRTIRKVIKNAKKYTRNIIVVCDGSKDGSYDIVKKENVEMIYHKKNKGLVRSLKKGFKYALDKGYDAVVKIDGDGQMDLRRYRKMLREYNRYGYDIVCAGYKDKKISWIIKKDMWIYSSLFNLATGNHVYDILSEYRLFSRKSMKEYINSKISDNASNISIVPLVSAGCSIRCIRGGVDYSQAHQRPFHIKGLIDLRKNFIVEIFKLNNLKSKLVGVLSIPLLICLLVFNVSFGFKYNSLLPKRLLRK